MMKFRPRKNKEYEAICWRGDNFSQVWDFCDLVTFSYNPSTLVIKFLDGTSFIVTIGDWILKQGEHSYKVVSQSVLDEYYEQV